MRLPSIVTSRAPDDLPEIRIAASLSTPSNATPKSTAEERWRWTASLLRKSSYDSFVKSLLGTTSPTGASLDDNRHANSQKVAAKSNWPTEDLKLSRSQ